MKPYRSHTALLRIAAALALTGLTSLSTAQNVANGKALYTSKLCEACHLPDVKRNKDGILAGANDARRILSECANQRDMKPLCATGKTVAVSNAEASDIAAYIASEVSAGAQAPVAQADVTDLDFGTQVLNAAALSKTVVIRNAGDAGLALAAANALTLGGTNVADFAVGNTGTCKNATTLAPGATCTVVLAFAAKAADNRAGSLTVKSNATDLVINLKGAAIDVAGPVAVVDLSTLDFGTQVLQTASAGKTVVLSNTGTADLVFDSANAFALSGADGQEFAVDATSTCSAATPVAAQGSCTIVLTFTPGAAGNRVATLTVNSNAATDPSVALAGAGQAAAGAAAEDDAGGCSMASPKAATFDPVLWLLACAALAVLLGRRRRDDR